MARRTPSGTPTAEDGTLTGVDRKEESPERQALPPAKGDSDLRGSTPDDLEPPSDALLVVSKLKKYFPIRQGFFQRLLQLAEQRRFVADRHLARGGAARIDRKRPLKIAEHADIIDDQTRLLVAVDAVRPRNGLHEGMVLHRLVEIDGRA